MGHGQTLELYTHNNKKYFLVACTHNNKKYFLVACTNKVNKDNCWSTEIGRIECNELTTEDTSPTQNHIIENSDIRRLEYLKYISGGGKLEVVRCDAALTADQKTLLIWSKLENGTIRYTYCDFKKINELWDAHKLISFNYEGLKKTILDISFEQSSKTRVFPQDSMQGIEVTNGNNIYISSGRSSQIPLICHVSKTGKWISTGHISLGGTPLSKTEIEGIKIEGENLTFCLKESNGMMWYCSIPKTSLD